MGPRGGRRVESRNGGFEEGLLDLIPEDLKEPFDPREVIVRIVDGTSERNGRPFDEFKPLYGTSLVTGWAQLHGRPIGILANAQGVLFSEEAQKATQFIQLANSADTPLVFLQNTTGYMVGKEYEQKGIIKDGAKMINAVADTEGEIFTTKNGSLRYVTDRTNPPVWIQGGKKTTLTANFERCMAKHRNGFSLPLRRKGGSSW